MTQPVEFDAIVIGQGLAGTALAWRLHWQGLRVMLVDRNEAVTSSRVAAGLMTSITGQRLVKSWRWDEFWPSAVAFYRRVEAETGAMLLHQVPTVRLVATDREVEYLARRRDEGFPEASDPEPRLNDAWFLPGRGGFQLDQGGRLDVATCLKASRQSFERLGQYTVADLNLTDDIELTATGVRLNRLCLAARYLFFCQGIAATENPWFQNIRFRPAKGEILTLRIDGLTEPRIVNRGVWLMRIGDGLYRAGATYHWSELNSVPTTAGRDEICRRLAEFLRLPFEVIVHDAAVRPILLHQYPVIGFHPDHRQLGYMNGLGSKGSLQAPALADHLTAAVISGTQIDPELGFERYLKPARKGSP